MKFRGVVAALVLTAALATAYTRGTSAAAKGKAAKPTQQIQSETWPQPAPEFVGDASDWINTDGKKLSMKQLAKQHRVVLVDFWEYTCVNCLRTLPYLQEWQKRYAKDGLVIVGIHTPEFAFAKERANVETATKKLGITWPVLVDSEYQNWNAYRNSFWPRKYFIDSKGRIIADHAGEGDYEESEAKIQKLLKQMNPTLKFPKPMSPVRDTDKPGAVCYPVTPELYAGERGSANGQHGNIDPFETGKAATFTDPGVPHEDGKIYAQGQWRTEAESLRHAQTTSDLSDYIALRYHALECNAVIKPEGGKPFRLDIAQDNKPVAKEDKGDDIRYDEKGASYILVDEPRMYRLTKNAKYGQHELRMASNSPDFGLYSFTFSSCEVH